MSFRCQRSRSVPLSIDLSTAKGSRVFKPYRSSSSDLPDRQSNRGPWGDLLKRIDHHEREGQLAEHDISSTNSIAETRSAVKAPDYASNPESPAFHILFLEMCQALEDYINGIPINSNPHISILHSLNAAVKLGRLGIDRGLIPCALPECTAPCRHHMRGPGLPRREAQALCKEIINQTARAFSRSKVGKPLTHEQVLDGYARREFGLDGQMAKSTQMDSDSACEECKSHSKVCIVVALDRFWRRRQCVECMRMKRSCSMNRAIWKGGGSLFDWYVRNFLYVSLLSVGICSLLGIVIFSKADLNLWNPSKRDLTYCITLNSEPNYVYRSSSGIPSLWISLLLTVVSTNENSHATAISKARRSGIELTMGKDRSA